MTTHIATSDIYAAPGVLAYKAGDVVPESAVANLGATDLVASQGTKAAEGALAEAAAQTEPEAPAKRR